MDEQMMMQPQAQGMPEDVAALITQYKLNREAFTPQQQYKIKRVAMKYGVALEGTPSVSNPVGNFAYGIADSLLMGFLPDDGGPQVSSKTDEIARTVGDVAGSLGGFVIGAGIGSMAARGLLRGMSGAVASGAGRMAGMSKIAGAVKDQTKVTQALSGFMGGAYSQVGEDPGGAMLSGLMTGGLNLMTGGKLTTNPFKRGPVDLEAATIAAPFATRFRNTAVVNGAVNFKGIADDPALAREILAQGETVIAQELRKAGVSTPELFARAAMKKAQETANKVGTGFTIPNSKYVDKDGNPITGGPGAVPPEAPPEGWLAKSGVGKGAPMATELDPTFLQKAMGVSSEVSVTHTTAAGSTAESLGFPLGKRTYSITFDRNALDANPGQAALLASMSEQELATVISRHLGKDVPADVALAGAKRLKTLYQPGTPVATPASTIENPQPRPAEAAPVVVKGTQASNNAISRGEWESFFAGNRMNFPLLDKNEKLGLKFGKIETLEDLEASLSAAGFPTHNKQKLSQLLGGLHGWRDNTIAAARVVSEEAADVAFTGSKAFAAEETATANVANDLQGPFTPKPAASRIGEKPAYTGSKISSGRAANAGLENVAPLLKQLRALDIEPNAKEIEQLSKLYAKAELLGQDILDLKLPTTLREYVLMARNAAKKKRK